MSRIIVKNLPREYTEKELRETFACFSSPSSGLVTDVRLVNTQDGKFRRFAFVGYEKEEDAARAIAHFDNSFIGSLRIVVENALPRGDSSLKKPFSKHSLSLCGRFNQINEEKKQQQREAYQMTVSSMEEKRKRLFSLYEDENDPELKAFLSVMRPRSKIRTWDNDDQNDPNEASRKNENKPMLTFTCNQEDGDLYEEWTPVCGKANEQQESPKESVGDTPNNSAGGSYTSEEAVYAPEELIKENGRLFIRSLSYSSCKEEDLEALFSKFGPLSEVHVPLTVDTKRPKGFAYVQYMLPEHALQAYKSLHGKPFQGRLLKICPANDKKEKAEAKEDELFSFKSKKKSVQKKGASFAGERWNHLFLSPDAVMEAVARQLGVSKRDLLNPEHSSLAARVSLAETHVINQTIEFFKKEGILLDSPLSKDEKNKKHGQRSKTILLLKNIPSSTSEQEISSLLAPFGTIVRLLIPPTMTLAVVEYSESQSAKAAFDALSYKKFHHVPLYLEYFPTCMIAQRDPQDAGRQRDQRDPTSTDDMEKRGDTEDKKPPLDFSESSGVLFVKNLNFGTTPEGFRDLFCNLNGFVDGKIVMKKTANRSNLSSGFGFVTFRTNQDAVSAMAGLRDAILDGHLLSIALAKDSTQKHGNGGASSSCSSKIIVRNVAFEATASDIKKLFSSFGQIRRVRLPKKQDGTHRGFCFVEFVSHSEAAAAFSSVCHSHLYGRHLALEWADEDTQNARRSATLKQYSAMREQGKCGQDVYDGEEKEEEEEEEEDEEY